VILFWGFKLV